MARLIIGVKDIKGTCAVHSIGDEIHIDGPEMDTGKTDRLCIHAMTVILHYAVALSEGMDPVKLGLAREEDKAYLHCPDPGKPYTDGGEVIFEVERMGD